MAATKKILQVMCCLATLGCLVVASPPQLASSLHSIRAQGPAQEFNDTVLLESVMKMYGANRSRSLNKRQLNDVLNFGKNSTRIAFVKRMQYRLDQLPWGGNMTCESVDVLLNDTVLSSPDRVNGTQEFAALLPRLFFAMQNPDCFLTKPKSRSLLDPFAWLYSMLAVLIMKLCALVGIAAFPFMSATVYTMALSFLVPLAISSLMGSTLFIFVPEILSLHYIPHYEENYGEPVLKMLTICAGIYLFYLIEKLLRLLMEHKEKKYYKNSGISSSYSLNAAETNTQAKPTRKISTTMAGDISSFPRHLIETKRDSRIEIDMGSLPTGIGSAGGTDSNRSSAVMVPQQDKEEEEGQKIAPIAWIAIMGDCIRNFIDGIAIGAAFSISPLVGVSLTLAFIFEEIPTELGDVAILLSAGMTICKASLYHLFAALFAFVGGALGILLGDLGESQIWIFCVSAGAFLYIALVDLMPEMNHALESEKARGIGRLKIFLLQNFGLVLGFAVTAVLGIYKDAMHIDLGGGGGGGNGH